jgi:benzylsuccinate CoA-transferase BbsE subunit/naphthyl-2-methylsuccinate CoA transferase subunit
LCGGLQRRRDRQAIVDDTGTSEAEAALADLRVLDLAGPIGVYCGKLLADLGATVVKVEPPHGDAMRKLGPYYDDEPQFERSLYWWHFNTSKLGITLDLETAAGKALFLRLAREADIVLESFAPGYLGGLGLGYEALHAQNPALILTSITPFGQTGPYSRFKGPDIVGQAMSGLMHQVGFPDRAPYAIASEMGYWTVSTLAADATMLALAFRDGGGSGQHVDVSMQQALTLGLGNAMPMYDVLGRVVGRGGLGLGAAPPMRSCYPCKDGFVFFLAAAPGTSMGAVADMLADHGFGEEFDPAWRDFFVLRRDPEQVERFEALMHRFFAGYTARELLHMGFDREPQVFVVPTDSAEGVVSSPHLQARGFFTEVEHDELGKSVSYPGPPYRLPESPWRIQRRAPLVGEHNREVYQGWLGVSDEELAELQRTGAV